MCQRAGYVSALNIRQRAEAKKRNLRRATSIVAEFAPFEGAVTQHVEIRQHALSRPAQASHKANHAYGVRLLIVEA